MTFCPRNVTWPWSIPYFQGNTQLVLTFCNVSGIEHFFSPCFRIPFDLPFEKLLVDAQALYEEYPPKTLEKEVKKRVERIKAQNQPRGGIAKPPSGLFATLPLAATVVIVTAPIVLGVLAYRWYYAA